MSKEVQAFALIEGTTEVDDVIERAISTLNPPANTDDVITQVIENVIGFLESGRRDLESANNKAGHDVRRSLGNSMTTTLLAGVEERVSYPDLVKLINEMRAGQARRRVALAGG